MKKVLILLVFVLSSISLKVVSQSAAPQLGKDPLSKVISAMTLEEKASLVDGGNRRV